MSPGRSGRVWRLPVRHADLHGVGEPAAVPGAVCVHLQEAALPQEDHHHVGQRSRARKSPAHVSHGGGGNSETVLRCANPNPNPTVSTKRYFRDHFNASGGFFWRRT